MGRQGITTNGRGTLKILGPSCTPGRGVTVVGAAAAAGAKGARHHMAETTRVTDGITMTGEILHLVAEAPFARTDAMEVSMVADAVRHTAEVTHNAAVLTTVLATHRHADGVIHAAMVAMVGKLLVWATCRQGAEVTRGAMAISMAKAMAMMSVHES